MDSIILFIQYFIGTVGILFGAIIVGFFGWIIWIQWVDKQNGIR